MNVEPRSYSIPSPSYDVVIRFLSDVNALAILARRRDTSTGSLAAFQLLQLLGAHETLTVPAIARLRRTSRQNIQVLVNRLRALGLVELVPNPGHQRSSLVRSTRAGKARLAEARQVERQRLEEVFSNITSAEIDIAMQVVRRSMEALAASYLRRARVTESKAAPAADQNDNTLPVNLL